LPLHLFSYLLDHALWGENAGGYHLSSLLIHALNSVLCFLVVRRLSGDAGIGLVAALLFAVHPAHVESVAWVSSRKDVVSTAFLLLSPRRYPAARPHEPIRYLAVKGHAVWNYLALLFGREGNPDYDLPGIGGSAASAVDLAGLLVLPALAYVLFRWKRRLEFLGVAWIFLMLLPALLFPLVTYMADRYLYAPSLGFFCA